MVLGALAGAPLGGVRDDGRRDQHLLGQDGDADDQQDDSDTLLDDGHPAQLRGQVTRPSHARHTRHTRAYTRTYRNEHTRTPENERA
eukprot:5630095-Pyramimonas_sp.AAC.1